MDFVNLLIFSVLCAYFSMISPESVIMFSKEMTEADLLEYNEGDAEHGSISIEDYEAWEEQWQKLARKYIRSDAEAIFTMPGKVTAFIADEIALEKMTPQPELIVFPPNYSRLSWNYENFKDISVYERHITLSPLPDASKSYVYRNLILDKKAGVAVVIDAFYTREGQMIYLMYPIDGKKAHWIRDRYIHNPGKGLIWSPCVDLLMTAQYVRYYCDRMTWSIGSWWDRKGVNEIDIVAENELDQQALFVEVKCKIENYDPELLNNKVEVFTRATGEFKDYAVTLKGLAMTDM